MTSADKVLIVGPSWVGDMVMAQALYKLLVERSPNVEIHVVAPRWSLPVLERMPEVVRAIELDVGHGELQLRKRRALGVRLRGERYDRAIVLPRSAKAALIPWFARARRRTGFRGEWRYGLLNDVRALHAGLDQTVKRFVALGQDRGEPPIATLPAALRPRLRDDVAQRTRLRAAHGLDESRALVALMPGAEYGPAKRWPARHFAELATRLAAAGADVVVLGSAKERALGDEIAGATGAAAVKNLCGQTTLTDVVDILAGADVAVSNDSGLLHVAAATGTPVVALYGSSSPQFTPPLSGAADLLYLGLECSPCFARECPLGHLRCLVEMNVASVYSAVIARLAERGHARPPRRHADG